MITNLGQMTIERLKGKLTSELTRLQELIIFSPAYEAKNGKGQFPQRIIMFRDGSNPFSFFLRIQYLMHCFTLGVSEGQFLTVVHEELPKVKDACKRVAQNYNPTITYVIAGKR